jgi:hypothetical protein
MEKVSKMMDEDQFWELVAQSLQNSGSQDEQEEFLINTLLNLSDEEIIGFRLRTDYLLYHTYQSEMWCAGYIMNGGCSDDGFEYFRLWVISRGREVYENAKANPDSLISEYDEEMGDNYEFEGFWYVALRAFEVKNGEHLYEYIDYDKFLTREKHYPNILRNWEEEKPETMQAICPQLYAKFWS